MVPRGHGSGVAMFTVGIAYASDGGKAGLGPNPVETGAGGCAAQATSPINAVIAAMTWPNLVLIPHPLVLNWSTCRFHPVKLAQSRFRRTRL